MKLKVFFKDNISDNLSLLKNRIDSILSLSNENLNNDFFYIDTTSKDILMKNDKIYPEYYDDIIGNFYNLVTEKGIYYNGKLYKGIK